MRLGEYALNLPNDMKDWRVSGLVDHDGDWKMSIIQDVLPHEVAQLFPVLLPPQPNSEDVCVWPGDRLGRFTVANAHSLLKGYHLMHVDRKWRVVWKLQAPERVRVFLWQVLHDRLLTNAGKSRWGLGSANCAFCTGMEETTLHVLRDCPLASEMWHHLVKVGDRSRFFQVSLEEWLSLNLYHGLGQGDLEWVVVWATGCAMLWKWRNKRVHDPNFATPFKPWDIILGHVQAYQHLNSTIVCPGGFRKMWQAIKWKPPKLGWVCLNTDGAAKASSNMAGYGGVLRGEHGN